MICDFGLSRVLDGVRGLTTCVHGDLRFQPPEDLEKTTSFIETKAQSSVLSSDQEYAAGDIFSFALVFYTVRSQFFTYSVIYNTWSLRSSLVQPLGLNTLTPHS